MADEWAELRAALAELTAARLALTKWEQTHRGEVVVPAPLMGKLSQKQLALNLQSEGWFVALLASHDALVKEPAMLREQIEVASTNYFYAAERMDIAEAEVLRLRAENARLNDERDALLVECVGAEDSANWDLESAVRSVIVERDALAERNTANVGLLEVIERVGVEQDRLKEELALNRRRADHAEARVEELGQERETVLSQLAAIAENGTEEHLAAVGLRSELAQARLERDELKTIINSDGSLTTHEEYIDILRDMASAEMHLPAAVAETERLQSELAQARVEVARVTAGWLTAQEQMEEMEDAYLDVQDAKAQLVVDRDTAHGEARQMQERLTRVIEGHKQAEARCREAEETCNQSIEVGNEQLQRANRLEAALRQFLETAKLALAGREGTT